MQTSCTHMTKKQEGQEKRQPLPHPGLESLLKHKTSRVWVALFFKFSNQIDTCRAVKVFILFLISSCVCVVKSTQGSVSLVCLFAASHRQSDPCCVFLPGLGVCTDTRSDSSTANTEQSLMEKENDQAMNNLKQIYLFCIIIISERNLTLIQGVGKKLVPECLVQISIRP